MRTIAYVRVSTTDQSNEKFHAAIQEKYPDAEIVEDVCSGKLSWRDRKLHKLYYELEEGDMIVTPELSRLGRSTLDILGFIEALREKGIDLHMLKEGIILSKSNIFINAFISILTVVVQLERDILIERIKEGLAEAKRKGKHLGRPLVYDIADSRIRQLRESGMSIREIAHLCQVSKGTIEYRLKKMSS